MTRKNHLTTPPSPPRQPLRHLGIYWRAHTARWNRTLVGKGGTLSRGAVAKLAGITVAEVVELERALPLVTPPI